jgi:hypothetical protein
LFCDETGFNPCGLSLTARNYEENRAWYVILWFHAHMLRGKRNKRFVDSGNMWIRSYARVLIVVCVTWRPISCGAANSARGDFRTQPSVSHVTCHSFWRENENCDRSLDSDGVMLQSFGTSDILNDIFYPKVTKQLHKAASFLRS